MKGLLPTVAITLLFACQSPEGKRNATIRDSLEQELKANRAALKEMDAGIFTDHTDYSQKGSYWTETTVDKITGKKTVQGREDIILGRIELENGKYKIPKNYISLRVYRSGVRIVTRFVVSGLGACVGDDDKINFLFKDGTRMQLNSEAEYNCNSAYAMWFSKSSKNLKSLATKELTDIRVTMNNEYFDLSVTEKEAIQVMRTVSAISEI